MIIYIYIYIYIYFFCFFWTEYQGRNPRDTMQSVHSHESSKVRTFAYGCDPNKLFTFKRDRILDMMFQKVPKPNYLSLESNPSRLTMTVL
jgi:hypothetical protein